MGNLESYYKTEEEKQFTKNIIDQDIYCLGNEYAELYMNANENWYDDVVNMKPFLDLDFDDYKEWILENYNNYEDAKSAIREWHENNNSKSYADDNYGPYDSYYNEFIEEHKENLDHHEVMQYFVVSNYLARQLESIGEFVLVTDSANIWGRTCCGQSIELDGTIQKIYRGLNNE